MRIYTRGGDRGKTGLVGGHRVSKSDVRVEAYGAVDELNALIGWAITRVDERQVLEELRGAQRVLFAIGAQLATPKFDPQHAKPKELVTADLVEGLERSIDRMEEFLPSLTAFILPGGGEAGALLHVARCVCRRAEREVVRLSDASPLPEYVLPYLNRLSDYLFVAARYLNWKEGREEAIW